MKTNTILWNGTVLNRDAKLARDLQSKFKQKKIEL